MSKIKNGGLDQYGAEPCERQQFWTAGVEGVNREECPVRPLVRLSAPLPYDSRPRLHERICLVCINMLLRLFWLDDLLFTVSTDTKPAVS